jgi:hypothetical protein
MNFLKEPPSGLMPNPPMNDKQLGVAGTFVDEVLELDVTGVAPGDRLTILNAPIFVATKEGQSGEWRVIADMLQRGENECIGSDPVFLLGTAHFSTRFMLGDFRQLWMPPSLSVSFRPILTTDHVWDCFIRLLGKSTLSCSSWTMQFKTFWHAPLGCESEFPVAFVSFCRTVL